ncbi:MAG: homocysteine S-methyltransferase family protein [Elusimicrobiota bacterium]
MINEIKNLMKEKILIFDGAMGTEINKRFYKNDLLPNDFLNLSNPQLIETIHLDYIKSGCDFIETNTFNSNPISLSDFNKENQTVELNKKAVEVAKSAIKKSGKKVFIAGSSGPLNISLSLGSKYSFDEVKKAYIKQAEVLLKEGVDLIIFETAHDIINLKAAIIGVIEILNRYDNLPVIASFTLNSNQSILSGDDIKAIYSNLSHFDIIAIGINCSSGPDNMELAIKNLSECSHLPTLIMPNAGFPDENGNYNLSPEDFTQKIIEYAQNGYINIAGGCCGTGPHHISELSKNLKNIKPRKLNKEKKFVLSHKIAIFEDEIEKPYLAAERLNTLGSKKFKKLIEENNKSEIISITKKQIEKGAHILDISFINTERVEIDDLKNFLPEISKNSKIPLMIDSTNINIHEEAAKLTGSKLIINSVNFENGDEKPKKAIELSKKYGSIIVCGLIDEKKEMAFNFERKMEIATRAFDFFSKHISNKFIIFDPLVFPIATVEYPLSAYDTLKAVSEIKKRFNVKTILGISNISYGLNSLARKYLNSVFLYLAIKNGLDIAIINIGEKIPFALIDEEIRELCISIINGNKEDIKRLLTLTQNKELEKETIESLTIEEKLKKSIMEGIGDIESILKELIKKYSASDIINRFIIGGMNEVGEKFSRGEYIVTEVLSSAAVAQKAIDFIKPYLSKENFKRGKLLIATVKGDVHDIGKNLVSIIFESAGFEIIDLGTKVEPQIIAQKACEIKPDIIGLSGLLSKSAEYMIETAKKLKENNLNIPLLIGGAAMSEKFVNLKIIPVYEKAFYAKDAIEGLKKAGDLLK